MRSFSLFLGHLLKLQGYNNQLPGDIESWRIPGRSHETRREDLEQIWIKLDKVFRDAGFTLWTHAFSFVLTIADYPSSSGFGYALPSRGNEGVGSLKKLRHFQYHVCSFYLSIQLTLRLIFIDRIHSRELHVPEMGLMSSSESSSLETKDTTI